MHMPARRRRQRQRDGPVIRRKRDAIRAGAMPAGGPVAFQARLSGITPSPLHLPLVVPQGFQPPKHCEPTPKAGLAATSACHQPPRHRLAHAYSSRRSASYRRIRADSDSHATWGEISPSPEFREGL